jgi:phosphatidate cytidylyltransferase
VLLLFAVLVVSDSGQYYAGRAFGRRPLSLRISPKKTVEGAIGGVVFATAVMVVGGRYLFASPIWVLGLLGATVSLLGIVGDLFESLLKRSANVKDSSNLIPGHGGVKARSRSSMRIRTSSASWRWRPAGMPRGWRSRSTDIGPPDPRSRTRTGRTA